MPFVTYLRLGSCAIFIVLSAHGAVTASADEVNSKRLEKLVQRLGDESYFARQRAAEELLRCGMEAKSALFDGMNSKDLEVVLRCRRLWSEVRIDTGWKQVREVIGDSPESRELYGQMFLAAPAFWYQLVETPRAADVLFEERRRQLQQQLISKQLSNWKGALANLLYFGVRAKQELSPKELPRVDDLLSTGSSQQALATSEPLRGLWGVWRIVTMTDGTPLDRLLIALQDRHPQALGIAREILRDSETPAEQRQYALLALVCSNSPEDEGFIVEALNDASSLDILFTNGRVIKSQLRDVALAVQINRNGKNPKDFGFKYLRSNDRTIYSPSTLGFRDSAEREAAFEKWAATPAK